jgi:hypothetical protein
VSAVHATGRAQKWLTEYATFEKYRDTGGHPPRHSFFFPIDEYDASHLDVVASLCRKGLGEVEIHHHHDNDTHQKLRDRLLQYLLLFRNRHGLLASHKVTGKTAFAFIHGNWALNNSRPDGRWCGINNEIKILLETGCYADFTLPSYPSNTQTKKVNSIYYAKGCDHKPKGHDTGVDVGTTPQPPETLMMIQGPLLRNWRSRKWGLFPRMENACLQANQPPTMERLKLWLKAAIRIPQRPDWYFVKLHTHGAPEKNAAMLLGEPMKKFHQGLADLAKANPNFKYHYVTAREMYNLARGAEAGFKGSVNEARDWELVWKP